LIGTAVRQALRDASYAVAWVLDGETAVVAGETELYDLVLLDLGRPGPSGEPSLPQGGQWLRTPGNS